MRKTILLLIIINICFLLTACETKKYNSYESYISDLSNSVYSPKLEIDLWYRDFINRKAEENKTFTYNGKKYELTYKDSIIGSSNSFIKNTYRSKERYEFSFRDDTGELCWANFCNREYYNVYPYMENIENAEDNAIKSAQEIALQYLDDINDYEIEIKTYIQTIEKDGIMYEHLYYRIEYIRNINLQNFFSKDKMMVKVDSKGYICQISIGDINVLNGKDIQVDEDRLLKAISNKIDDIFKDSIYEVVNHKIQRHVFAVTPDKYKRLCVNSSVLVEFKGKQTNYSMLIMLTTFLE